MSETKGWHIGSSDRHFAFLHKPDESGNGEYVVGPMSIGHANEFLAALNSQEQHAAYVVDAEALVLKRGDEIALLTTQVQQLQAERDALEGQVKLAYEAQAPRGKRTAALQAENAALRNKAALADEMAEALRNLGVVQIGGWPLINDWLAKYAAALKAASPEGAS